MVEMVVCAVILSTVAAILAPALHGVKRQRQATRFETMALIEMNNIADQLKTAAAAAGKDIDVAETKLSSWFANRYSAATLQVETLPVADGDVLQPVAITIARTAFNGEVEIKRTLVTWLADGANE